MNNRILTVLFFLASVILAISDRIYLLPIPPAVAQWWWFVLAIAGIIAAFQRKGRIDIEDVERIIEAWAKKPIPAQPVLPPIPHATPPKTAIRIIPPLVAICAILGLSGCAEYAIHPSFEYRSRGLSATVSYDGKSIKPRVTIYDKSELDKDLKGLAK